MKKEQTIKAEVRVKPKPVLHAKFDREMGFMDFERAREILNKQLGKDYHVIVTDNKVDFQYPHTKRIISDWEKKMQVFKIGLMIIFLVMVGWYLSNGGVL